MDKEDILKWLKDFWGFIIALIGEIGYLFSNIGEWLVSVSPVLDALIKFFMLCILIIYFLKAFVGLRIPVLAPVFERLRKIFGVRDKKMVTISIAETDGEVIEAKMNKFKILYNLIINTLKKGKRIMKKVFSNIFKWIYYNKFTLLGCLSLLVVGVGIYFKIFKPELVANYIDDKAFVSAIGGLLAYGLFAVFGKGAESFATYEQRVKNKELQKAYEKEQKEKLKEELRRNKLVNIIIKEIEELIIPKLQERLLNETSQGIRTTYRSLVSVYNQLSWEYIVADLGGDEELIKKLKEELDRLAKEYNLIDKGVNLITKELQSK